MSAAQYGIHDPDPAVVAANVYTSIMENERVRVFDLLFEVNENAVMHHHPDHVVYVRAGGTLRLTFADGKSQDFVLQAGQALCIGAGEHAAQNVGPTEIRAVVVELKEPPKAA